MNRHPRDERGVLIVWLALFLIVLLGVTSLGIDMAKLMTARSQLQNAADAAALAGASAINTSTGVILPDSAVIRAQQISRENKAFIDDSQPVELAAADVEVIDTDKVKVTVRRQGGEAIVTQFARLFGVTTLDMTADATAQATQSTTVDCGLVPLAGIPLSGPFQPGCANAYTLKQPGANGANGNYQALRMPDCGGGPCKGSAGASLFRCNLEKGSCCPLSVGDAVETEPGNMSGPTKSAIQTRFDRDTDKRAGICYDDYRTKGNGSRIVYVPITTPPGNGHSTVTVTGFAAFFLKNVPGSGANSQIDGEFLDLIVPGHGNGSNPGATTYSLRLIE